METGSITSEGRLYFVFGLAGVTVAGRYDQPASDFEYARTVAEVVELELPWPATSGNRPREQLDESRLREGRRWVKTGEVVNCFPPPRLDTRHYPPIAELNQ